MARISIDLPERFTFSTSVALLNIHINFSGHLDNALLLTLVSEARTRFWQSLGYRDGRDICGVICTVGDAAIVYRSAAYHGESLCIDMAACDFARYGFDFLWRISEQASGREVARGKTGMVCIDTETHRVTALPEKLRRELRMPEMDKAYS